MNKRLKWLVGFFMALVIPLSIFFLAKGLSKDRVLLPKYYGIEKISDNDTMYIKAPDLMAINQLDNEISINNSLKEKVLIVGFLDKNCQKDCADYLHNIRLMQKAFLKKIPEKFQFITLTNFSPLEISTMRSMADSFQADHDRWWFLADNGFNTLYWNNILKNSAAALPSSLILLDEKRHIRGYYDANDPVALKQCADDAILITLEKNKKK